MKKRATTGFSTIELMIALAILSLVLSAVIVVAFSSQSFLVGNQTTSEAMKLAQGLLEREQALARKDFNLVNPIPETTDGVYASRVEVSILNEDEDNPDYLQKLVKAVVRWKTDRGVERELALNTIIANFTSPHGNNTCNSTLSGDWSEPEILNSTTDFKALIGDSDPLAVYPVTDVDSYRGKLYVTVNNTSSNNKDTLFVFDILDPDDIDLDDSTDNSSVAAGLNAVAVADGHVFAASGHGADFGTCTAGGNCAQLQIFDADNLSKVADFKVPGVTGTGGQAIGKSIFYKDGFVFLGLAKTGSGPEFNIIDVHDPANPFLVGGSYSVGAAVNALQVRNQYVYLASPNAEELTILDLEDLDNVYTYDAPDSAGNGKSIYLLGDTLYLGRTVTGSNPEFYILDNSDPSQIEENNPAPETYEASASVRGIIVRDYLVYLLTTSSLQILNVTDPDNISDYADLSLSGASGSSESALDCEGNYLYASNTNGRLYVIGPEE